MNNLVKTQKFDILNSIIEGDNHKIIIVIDKNTEICLDYSAATIFAKNILRAVGE